MSILKDIESLINRFGQWVAKLFDNSEKIYKLLTDEEKKYAEWSYGVIAIINNHVDDVDEALKQIGIKYPDVSMDVIHGFLEKIVIDTKIVVADTPLTLKDAAQAVATHLSRLEGQTWQQISQTLGNLLAIAFSPDTPVQKFIAAAEYIYRAIVKPHVEA